MNGPKVRSILQTTQVSQEEASQFLSGFLERIRQDDRTISTEGLPRLETICVSMGGKVPTVAVDAEQDETRDNRMETSHTTTTTTGSWTNRKEQGKEKNVAIVEPDSLQELSRTRTERKVTDPAIVLDDDDDDGGQEKDTESTNPTPSLATAAKEGSVENEERALEISSTPESKDAERRLSKREKKSAKKAKKEAKKIKKEARKAAKKEKKERKKRKRESIASSSVSSFSEPPKKRSGSEDH